MVRDGIHAAVLDRVEGDDAIRQLEADGEAVDRLLAVRSTLHGEGDHRDAALTAGGSDGVAAVRWEPVATGEPQAAARARFDRLAARTMSPTPDPRRAPGGAVDG